MKKNIFLSFFALSISLSFYSQSHKTATNFGNNTTTTMYNVQGTVYVVLNSSTSVSISLGTDFSTASGPDVRFFLVDRGNLTDA